jgi:hypothetical protein
MSESGVDLARFGGRLMQEAVDMGHREIVDFLLERGVGLADICLSGPVENDWLELLDHLADCGGDLNAEGEEHPPPIVCCLCRHEMSVVHHLLQRGARLDPAIIESHMDCLHYAIGRKDQARLDLVLAHAPDLSQFRGLVVQAIRACCSNKIDSMQVLDLDLPAAVAMVRSLIQHGARGFHDPPPTPKPGAVGEALQRPPLLTPVDYAILMPSMDLLRLFDEAGCDWRTVRCFWKPESPEETEVHTFLAERGATMKQILSRSVDRGGFRPVKKVWADKS